MHPELGSLLTAGVDERDLTIEDVDVVDVERRDLVQQLVQIDRLVWLGRRRLFFFGSVPASSGGGAA